MGGLPSTFTNESIFRIRVPAKISCQYVPEKNMAEAVTRDMASSDWLKLAALCLFRAQSVSKNKSICDCAGQTLYLIHSCGYQNRESIYLTITGRG